MQEISKMRKIVGILATCAIGAIAAGCSDSSGTGSGLLTVRLTDAPFPFSNVADVDVYVVRVTENQATSIDEDAADESSEGWTTIATPNALITLLNLGNHKVVTLGAATLPTGTYKIFRLILATDKSSITEKYGPKPPIFFPSAGHSGIKVILDQPIHLTENGSVTTLDFDIGRSFVMRGKVENGFNFRPVIHAIAQDITGSVSGSVHANSATGAGAPGATVEVLTAGSLVGDSDPAHVVRTTATDANGNFSIAFLMPGAYVLRATRPTASGLKPALLDGGLTIVTGTETANQVIVVAP